MITITGFLIGRFRSGIGGVGTIEFGVGGHGGIFITIITNMVWEAL